MDKPFRRRKVFDLYMYHFFSSVKKHTREIAKNGKEHWNNRCECFAIVGHFLELNKWSIIREKIIIITLFSSSTFLPLHFDRALRFNSDATKHIDDVYLCLSLSHSFGRVSRFCSSLHTFECIVDVALNGFVW